MPQNLKYASYIIVAIVALVIVIRISNCTTSLPYVKGRAGEEFTVTPPDSSFSPTDHRTYTPPTPLSGLSNRIGNPPPARLPKGVKNKDVQQVVSIKVDGIKPIDVIIAKDGGVYVEKFEGLQSVTSTAYNPPAIAFAPSAGIGVTLSTLRSPLFAPSVSVSLFEISGWLHAPTIVVDLSSIGLGVEGQLYHDFYLGGAIMWRYEDSKKEIKATLHFIL